MKKILVPTDFTQAASQAISQALALARLSGASLTLLHVLDNLAPDITAKLKGQAQEIARASGIPCHGVTVVGPVLDKITEALTDEDFDMAVIGTHGAQGIRQKWFGADIAKLVARIPVPVLVVQENSPVISPFRKILIPVGSHEGFGSMVESAVLFAALCPGMEVYFYSIHKPGFEWPEAMHENIREATRVFEENGIRLVRIREDQEDSSHGFARQTVRYAHSAEVDAIWMMSVASEEFYYMSKVYKETILLNEYAIPVMCVGGVPEM